MRTRTLFGYLLVASISALITYFIFGTTTDPVTPEPDAPDPTENTKEICMKYDDDDMNTLNVDLVHTMTEEYIKNQWDFINSSAGFKSKFDDPQPDARSIWFDLKSLKRFLYHIENVAVKRDTTLNEDNLGVRFYYATYPDKDIMERFGDLNTTSRSTALINYHNRHTLVMIPTIQRGDSILDFNPLDPNTYDGTLYNNQKYKKNDLDDIDNVNPRLILSLTGTPDNRRTGSKNHGSLAPPDATLGMGF